MEPTETEKLLAQARAICQTITDRVEVSDALLQSVFDRLCLEIDLQPVEHGDDLPAPGSIH